MREFNILMAIPSAGTLTASTKSQIWRTNLYQPLVKMGHRVVLLDYDYDQFFTHAESDRWLEQQKGRLSETLADTFAREHAIQPFDLCFFYFCDGFIDEGVLSAIRAKGVPVFNYSCNNIHQFHLVQKICRLVDCNVYTEAHAAEKFAALGIPAVQMQMAANPDFYAPTAGAYRYEASFVGQRYADRGELAAVLIAAGVNVQAFGPRWQANGEAVGNVTLSDRADKFLTMVKKNGLAYALRFLANKVAKRSGEGSIDRILAGHANGILDDAEMVRVFAESKINLGFATVYSGGHEGGEELYHLRLRDFEIPMSGGFYLTRYTKELESYFDIGREIECYRSKDELINKCRFYLAHDDRRELIRKAGLTRSRASHTWEHRFTEFFANPKVAALIGQR
jgi:spore maturation protein CgeB